MSTYWRPIPDIPFAKLFDGRLEKYGIKAVTVDRPTEVISTWRDLMAFCRFTKLRTAPAVSRDGVLSRGRFSMRWLKSLKLNG